jgi:hypothetical protein
MKSFRVLALVSCSCVCFFLVLVASRSAEAHIAKNDGNITVTLHINPEDYPVINVPQELTFIYGTLQDGFNANNCDCKMEMKDSNGALVLKKDVPATGNYFGEIPYTFRNTGVYRIYLSGRPTTPKGFQPFSFNYSIRVALAVPGGTPAPPPESLIKKIAIIAGVSAIILLALGAVVYQIIRDSRENKE